MNEMWKVNVSMCLDQIGAKTGSRWQFSVADSSA